MILVGDRADFELMDQLLRKCDTRYRSQPKTWRPDRFRYRLSTMARWFDQRESISLR